MSSYLDTLSADQKKNVVYMIGKMSAAGITTKKLPHQIVATAGRSLEQRRAAATHFRDAAAEHRIQEIATASPPRPRPAACRPTGSTALPVATALR